MPGRGKPLLCRDGHPVLRIQPIDDRRRRAGADHATGQVRASHGIAYRGGVYPKEGVGVMARSRASVRISGNSDWLWKDAVCRAGFSPPDAITSCKHGIGRLKPALQMGAKTARKRAVPYFR